MSPAARDVVRRCKPYAAALAGLGAALGLIYGATGEPPWLTAPGLGLLAAAASAAVFLLGLALLRALLSLGWPPLAVARTVLDEALRMRIAVVFILMLLALLTLLPLTLDPGSPLRYRVQSFLSFSLGAAETLLCLMTIFLACGTLCDEIADRRIYTIATKPIGRGAYLLGKWLGLLLLNLLLLAVTGLSIFGFARLLAVQPALDAEDAAAVQEQILTARRTVRPAPPEGLDAEIERRLAEIAEKDPEFLAEQGRGRLARQVGHQALLNARSLSPHQRVSFTFENLGEAARSAGELQLRFKFRASKATDDGKLALRMALNGREQLVRPSIDTFYVWKLPARAVDAEGKLVLTVIHEQPGGPEQAFDGTVIFPPDDGPEILYPVDGFGMNLARGMAMTWIKLGFLAALGLLAGTFLGFPVACLLALAVFVLAAASGTLLESLEYFGENTQQQAMKAVAVALREVLGVLATLLKQFSRFAPHGDIVTGRLVPWSDVTACAGWIGLLWTGLTGLSAWLVFRARELAKGTS